MSRLLRPPSKLKSTAAAAPLSATLTPTPSRHHQPLCAAISPPHTCLPPPPCHLRWCTQDPATTSYSHALLHYKGFHAVQAHRIAHELWARGDRSVAAALQVRARARGAPRGARARAGTAVGPGPGSLPGAGSRRAAAGAGAGPCWPGLLPHPTAAPQHPMPRCALPRQSLGDRGTDAAGRAGHQRGLSGQHDAVV